MWLIMLAQVTYREKNIDEIHQITMFIWSSPVFISTCVSALLTTLPSSLCSVSLESTRLNNEIITTPRRATHLLNTSPFNYIVEILLALFPDLYVQSQSHKIGLGKCLFSPNTKWDPGDIMLHSTLSFTSKTLLGINWHISLSLLVLWTTTRCRKEHII